MLEVVGREARVEVAAYHVQFGKDCQNYTYGLSYFVASLPVYVANEVVLSASLELKKRNFLAGYQKASFGKSLTEENLETFDHS